ncbi:MAG: DUF2996 domain-containing protein [Synechococcaceae cyanobacterium SM2_3_1]|nr:DUF2996 domain-containing protein [Synechococcaceae cyanobacterium SM2_3_1]
MAETSNPSKPKGKSKEKEEEAKPFSDQIREEVIPATQKALQARGVTDLELSFKDKTLVGTFADGRRQFRVLFAEDSLTGKKFFSYSVDGLAPSTVESFMIDERKIDVNLVAFYMAQRLQALQWY